MARTIKTKGKKPVVTPAVVEETAAATPVETGAGAAESAQPEVAIVAASETTAPADAGVEVLGSEHLEEEGVVEPATAPALTVAPPPTPAAAVEEKGMNALLNDVSASRTASGVTAPLERTAADDAPIGSACGSCWGVLPLHAKFCTACGARQGAPEAPKTVEPTPAPVIEAVCEGCKTPRKLPTDRGCRKCGKPYAAATPAACAKCAAPRRLATDRGCRKCGTQYAPSN